MEKTLLTIAAAGVLSCLAMDLWQQVLKRLAGVPASNWSLVGRWFLSLRQSGTMYAPTIASMPAAPRETSIGWLVHYAVAIGYALIFWLLMVPLHVLTPSLLTGFVFGALSVAVPWFYFMPCMGNGVMGSKTAHPRRACAVSLSNHLVFGIAMAWAFRLLLA